MNWHYSKSIPVPPLVKIGAWEDGVFIGVVIFSRGASSNLMNPYGLKNFEGCELTRIALNKHQSTVSQIMSKSIKLLKKTNEGLKLIVSFADPHEGHHGGVYQATNWIYTGISQGSIQYTYNGKNIHSRQISEKGWNIQQGVKRKTLKPSQCDKLKKVKHRYIFPLNKKTRKKVLVLSKEYPKRNEHGEIMRTRTTSEIGGQLPGSAPN